MNKKVVFIAFLLIVLCNNHTHAQQISPQNLEKLQIMEDSLLVSADSMYSAFLPDTRPGYSERFARQLVRALKIPNSYFYSFGKLEKLINVIQPDDKSFRVLNWEIKLSPILKRYYGAIQMPEENLKLYGLRDCSELLGKGAEDSILTGGKWFGALYYRILTQEIDGRRLYTVLGLNDESPVSKRKVMDILIINPGGITFGAPVFGIGSTNNPRQRINRFILEYKKDVQASMNWNDERGMVVFDKLQSQINDPGRKYTYVPTGQYDGLRWGNDMWNYVRDLIPVQELQDGQAPGDEPAPKK